jgi:hypothetical protein
MKVGGALISISSLLQRVVYETVDMKLLYPKQLSIDLTEGIVTGPQGILSVRIESVSVSNSSVRLHVAIFLT